MPNRNWTNLTDAEVRVIMKKTGNPNTLIPPRTVYWMGEEILALREQLRQQQEDHNGTSSNDPTDTGDGSFRFNG